MLAGPVDLSNSPYVGLRPVPVNAVQLQDEFWKPRLDINRTVTIPAQLKHIYETGRIDNFRRAAGKIGGEFKGLYPFDDSDVYKWAEAASWSLATHPDPKLETDLDAVIQEIADAQQLDGYLNTYFMFEREAERFTNLKDKHEIYCAGHLIQAAIAHHRATGKTTLLNIAIRFADLLDSLFGPEPKRLGTCGHEEAEMALVELYRETGEVRYLNLARFMIDARGRKPGLFGGGRYFQDHAPFIEQKDMTGHAVRQMYLNCGASDVYAEQGNQSYRLALETLWNNFTTKRMYVTGAAGARHEGEAFGEDYELPNERAYAETCAAIGSVMWNWRMLNITGEAKYADLMEHTLYNAVLPGLSLDGKRYFYENPLADAGKHRRQEWFGCACCPPNIARLLASLPGYFYSVTDSSVWTHLYASGTADIHTPNGGHITITQQTKYPWDGNVAITVKKHNSLAEFLYLRIPAWAHNAGLDGTGQIREDEELETGGYVKISLKGWWDETIRLSLPMRVKTLRAQPYVIGNRNHIALQRGPLVYCVEDADYPNIEYISNLDVRRLSLSREAAQKLQAEWRSDLLGGVCVLRGEAVAQDMFDMPPQELYASIMEIAGTSMVPFTAIPYYAWANREPGAMQVWIPIE